MSDDSTIERTARGQGAPGGEKLKPSAAVVEAECRQNGRSCLREIESASCATDGGMAPAIAPPRTRRAVIKIETP
jgi:hypothetical protein